MHSVALFDIDLTLVNTNGAGRAAMRRAFDELGLGAEVVAQVPIDGRTDRAIFLDALERVGMAPREREAALPSVVERYLRRLPEELTERGGRVLAGAREVVEALAARGWALGLATGNLRAGAERKLKHFGLWEAFAFGGFGDRVTVRAAVVREAIVEAEARLGRPPAAGRAWVIGDTPLDVEAAHAVGLRALAVATGNYSVEQLRSAGADAVVPSLRDVARVLAVLEG